ncbi:MAG: hypothetical protein ACXV8R_07855 [Acidimicrobiia bacterium]
MNVETTDWLKEYPMRGPVTASRVVGLGALMLLGLLVPVTAAAAADYPNGGTPPSVSPNQAGTTVEAKTVTQSTGTLPFTGGDVAGLAAIGAATAGVGFVLVRRSRRTTSA